MRWEDERYVRVYTRDTTDWLALSFDAQALFLILLRKVDRAGLLPLGKHGKRGVAIAIGHPGQWSRLEPALEELLVDGCVKMTMDGGLLVPNFLAAQEARASDKARQQKARELARDTANVTHRESASQNVTECHTPSHAVTPSRAVLSHAVPKDLPAPSSPTPRAELCLEQQEPPKRARQKRKDGAAPDPRHGPLAASLVAAGWPHHGGRTAKAISELLALADRIPPGLMPPEGAPAEVLRRAAIAKAYEGFPRVRELHELADKWGHFETTPTSGRGPAPPSDFSRNVPLPERSEFAPPVDDTPF